MPQHTLAVGLKQETPAREIVRSRGDEPQILLFVPIAPPDFGFIECKKRARRAPDLVRRARSWDDGDSSP